MVNQLLQPRPFASGAPTAGLGAVSVLLANTSFQPTQPRNLEESGLPESLVDSLICKHLAVVGQRYGKGHCRHPVPIAGDPDGSISEAECPPSA